MLDRHAASVRTSLAEGAFRRDVAPRARFERFFAALTAMLREECKTTGGPRGCPIGNIVSELSTRDELVRAAASRALDALRTTFAETLRDARADGTLAEGVDPDVGADAILAYLQGLAVLGKAYRNPARLERLAAMAPALFAPAPPPAAARRRGPVRRKHTR